MHKLLFILFLIQAPVLFAQPGVADVVEINGAKFYKHKVEAGNTLWGLQQMYDVPVEEILKANPELSEGLKVGQQINIPFSKDEAVKEAELIDYKVKKGETLYGISKKFDVSIDDLISYNPEIANGLKKGQLIKVPREFSNEEVVSDVVIPEVKVVDSIPSDIVNPFVTEPIGEEGLQEEITITFSDSTIRHTVLVHETMYSISKRFMVSIDEIMELNDLRSSNVKEGQVLLIPVKNERITKVPIKGADMIWNPESTDSIAFEKKEKYKIAIMVPFYLDYGDGYSKNISNLATQFYMGTSIAIDSLKALGLNAEVFYYDTKRDSLTVVSILKKPEFGNMDLIIGPFFNETQVVVAAFAKENKVRMVCPLMSNSSILENNRLVYCSVPSNITLMEGLASYTLENNAADNILLVKPTKESDLILYEAFKNAFYALPIEEGKKRPLLIETDISNMKIHIKRGVKTIFIVPTNDRNTAMAFMNSMNRSSFRSKTKDLYVYGTKEWASFTDINNIYKNQYHFHYAGPNFVNFYSDKMINMNERYRELYKTDITKMAVQGYDVMMYYSSLFLLGTPSVDLLMNNFNCTQVSNADGFENSNVFVVKQDDFELKDAQIILE